jgi:hypothetical protein
MKQVMRNLYRDTYSNVFDPAIVSNIGLASCQAILMKMILSLQAPVLSTSQMFDSMPLLILARDPDFLKILRRGIISTSLFGEASSLREYVEYRLLRKDHIFNCFPFLPQGSNSGKLSVQTKKILLSKIKNNGKSGERYPKDIEKYAYFLDTFVEGVIKLDSSLKTDPSDEVSNYRHNFLSTMVVPLSQQIERNIAVLENHSLFRRRPIIRKFANMTSRIHMNHQNINERTRYYDLLGNYQDIEETEKQQIMELIDVSYHQTLAPLIAETSRMVIRKENEYANVLLQEIPKKNSKQKTQEDDTSERYMNTKLERVYDEIHKDSVLSCNDGKKLVMLEALNDILNTVESCMNEIPRAEHEAVINYVYDRYCSVLEKNMSYNTGRAGCIEKGNPCY